MLNQVVLATLRILFLRAGPEDFPYEAGKRLLVGCVAAFVIANAWMASTLMSPPVALVASVMNAGVLALMTRIVLKLRQLPQRFQQTYNALMTTNAVFALLLLPLIAQVAPLLVSYAEQIEKLPAGTSPATLTPPQLPMFTGQLLLVVAIWQLVVMGFIFQRAGGRLAVLVIGVFWVITMLLSLSL